MELLRHNRPNDAAPKLVLNQVGQPKRPEIPVKDFAETFGVEPSTGAGVRSLCCSDRRPTTGRCWPNWDRNRRRWTACASWPAMITGRKQAERESRAVAFLAVEGKEKSLSDVRKARRDRDQRQAAACGDAGRASARPSSTRRATPPRRRRRRHAVQPRAFAADERSEDYYQIKTTIFSALIDTIDLAQLAQLDPDSAREEIRDIVNEIISIKAVVMSIAEQEHLLQDICNDVLGYGPLEPLLGARRHRRHHGQRRRARLHRSRRQGAAHHRSASATMRS